jgi:hypothetical protein
LVSQEIFKSAVAKLTKEKFLLKEGGPEILKRAVIIGTAQRNDVSACAQHDPQRFLAETATDDLTYDILTAFCPRRA